MTDESQTEGAEVLPQPPISEQQRQSVVDDEQLRILSIVYWVLGGTHVFAALYGLVYVGMGVFWGQMASTTSYSSDSPPYVFAWFFGAFGLLFMLGFGTLAALQILSGFWIRQRKHRVVVLVTAGISTLSIPFGTLVGVFTFIVFSRPSVATMFDAGNGLYPRPADDQRRGCGVLIAVGLIVLLLLLCALSCFAWWEGTRRSLSEGTGATSTDRSGNGPGYEYPPSDSDVWDEDFAEETPPPDEPKSGKPDAGTSMSPDGRWTVKLYWLSKTTDPARLQVDLEDKKEEIKLRAFIDVPSQKTAPHEENGDLVVDWDEIDDEYMKGLAVGGQSLYLDEMFRVYE